MLCNKPNTTRHVPFKPLMGARALPVANANNFACDVASKPQKKRARQTTAQPQQQQVRLVPPRHCPSSTPTTPTTTTTPTNKRTQVMHDFPEISDDSIGRRVTVVAAALLQGLKIQRGAATNQQFQLTGIEPLHDFAGADFVKTSPEGFPGGFDAVDEFVLEVQPHVLVAVVVGHVDVAAVVFQFRGDCFTENGGAGGVKGLWGRGNVCVCVQKERGEKEREGKRRKQEEKEEGSTRNRKRTRKSTRKRTRKSTRKRRRKRTRSVTTFPRQYLIRYHNDERVPLLTKQVSEASEHDKSCDRPLCISGSKSFKSFNSIARSSNNR